MLLILVAHSQCDTVSLSDLGFAGGVGVLEGDDALGAGFFVPIGGDISNTFFVLTVELGEVEVKCCEALWGEIGWVNSDVLAGCLLASSWRGIGGDEGWCCGSWSMERWHWRKLLGFWGWNCYLN